MQYPGNYSIVKHQLDLQVRVGNFWSYVDGRDVASAVERTVEAFEEVSEGRVCALRP